MNQQNPYDLPTTNGQEIPVSPEAERSVLGALMLDKDAIVHIADMLQPDDFYHDHHRYIYEAAMTCFQQATPADVTSLSAQLKNEGKLELIGGQEYLRELVQSTPLATRITHYARYVKHTSVLRKLIKVGQQISALGYKSDEEIAMLLEQAEKYVFGISQQFVRDRFIHIKEVLQEKMEHIHEIQNNPDALKEDRVATGFRDLDSVLSGGFGPSDLVILAARPSMGKTALALEFTQRAALTDKNGRKKKVAIISLEMSKEQITARMLGSQLRVESWRLRKAQFTEQQQGRLGDVISRMSTADIFIDDNMGGSMPELRAKIRRLQMERGLDMLVVDYLQLMSTGNTMNRVQEISEISRSLKLIARELKIPVIALSQLSRNVEQRPDKRPVMSDLRDSGSIEQDADVIMMLYRESYYERENTDDKTLEVNVIKHRNGATGRVKVLFDLQTQQFGDLDKRSQDVFED